MRFEEELQHAFMDARERRNDATIGDSIRGQQLGRRVADLLSEDEATCCQLANDYTRGTYSTAAIETLRKFAEIARDVLKRQAKRNAG
jgi:hypothetical protein